MAEVLPPESQPHFPSHALRRSHPSSTFLVGSPNSLNGIQPKYSESLRTESTSTASSSCPPSLHSSHVDLHQAASLVSTPSTSLSLDSSEGEEEELTFPSYGGDDSASDRSEDMEDQISPRTACPEPTSSNDSNKTPTHPPDFPLVSEDDTAVCEKPTRHVDYLSHDWQEEDIWASWRHIVSQRRIYGEQSRLENASWRTWGKQKYGLKTIPPEKLNWLKDVDVTWLYGPLQTSRHASEPTSSLSKSNSFLDKKPILKKRSMSEVMLQKSISTSSLVKSAVAAVKAQEDFGERRSIRPALGRTTSDYVTSVTFHGTISREATDSMSSCSTSGLQTPASGERRHIRFDEKVAQCIAVDPKEGYDGEEEEEEEHVEYAVRNDEDDSSDDGLVMMKRRENKRLMSRSSSRTSLSGESKTIAMLPSATLKYRTDSPDIPDHPSHSVGPSFYRPPRLSPSASQETLRPSNPSRNFLISDESDEDDEDGDEEEEDISWEPSAAFSNRIDSLEQLDRQYAKSERMSSSSSSGMRRTSSGMFMPLGEPEDEPANRGLFGTVLDGVNTARDIAHVIWNVGWRSGNDD